MYKYFFKRVLDFLISFIGLIIISPIFIIVTIFLLFANQGKPFFIQTRPGKNTRLFKIIKFKTMNDKRGADGVLLPDAQRLTYIGSFIRKTSIDELPQLLNVIIGDMSLIGPRPLLPAYLPFYSVEQKRRHNIRPGITGLAQISGRNSIDWDKKFEYDVCYVENLSFFLDLKILYSTIKKVFKSEGISADGHVTMPTFIDYVKEKKQFKE